MFYSPLLGTIVLAATAAPPMKSQNTVGATTNPVTLELGYRTNTCTGLEPNVNSKWEYARPWVSVCGVNVRASHDY